MVKRYCLKSFGFTKEERKKGGHSCNIFFSRAIRLPNTSDNMIEPAPTHFLGNMLLDQKITFLKRRSGNEAVFG